MKDLTGTKLFHTPPSHAQPPSKHTYAHSHWFTNQILYSISLLKSWLVLQHSVLVNPCIEGVVSFPGVLGFVLRNTDFISFNYACWKEKHIYCIVPHLHLRGELKIWGKGRTKRGIVAGCRSVLLVCCSLEHSMVSHNTVSFLLEVPALKDWVCLQIWRSACRPVCSTVQHICIAFTQCFQFTDMNFLSSTSAVYTTRKTITDMLTSNFLSPSLWAKVQIKSFISSQVSILLEL